MACLSEPEDSRRVGLGWVGLVLKVKKKTLKLAYQKRRYDTHKKGVVLFWLTPGVCHKLFSSSILSSGGKIAAWVGFGTEGLAKVQA